MSEADNEQVTEFGGSLGAVAIMVGSHLLLYWLWIAWRFEDGAMPLPEGLADVGSFATRMGVARFGATAL